MRNTFNDDDDDLNAWIRICDRMTDNNRKNILMSVLMALVVFTAIFAWFQAVQNSSTSTSVDAAAEKSMFEVVDHNTTPNIVVVYHKKTKVMYMMPKNGSVATVMVDADGKPLLYEP